MVVRKQQIECSLPRGFYCSPVSLAHKASVSLDIRVFVHGSTKSCSVLMGKPHTHTRTLPYIISALRSSIFELATSPGAELRYLKVGISQCFSKSSVLAQKTMRILHNNHIYNIYFNTEKYPLLPPKSSVEILSLLDSSVDLHMTRVSG